MIVYLNNNDQKKKFSLELTYLASQQARERY